MKIEKILWPTDGSQESEESLRLALYLARVFGSDVACLHVCQVPKPLIDISPGYEDVIADIVKSDEEKFGKEFEHLRETNPGLRFSPSIVRGDVAEWIMETSKSGNADIVVMGKRGLGLIGSMLLGSNTLKVLRDSSVPVLSVKSAKDKKEYDIKKILVPFDTGDTADSALHYALWLAGKTGASVTVLYVLWIDVNICEISRELVTELKQRAGKVLGDRVDRIRSEYQEISGEAPTEKIETRIESGVSPALKVTGYARDNGFDLIVLNTHGRKGFDKLLLGSEAEKIIREATCPVLAMKP